MNRLCCTTPPKLWSPITVLLFPLPLRLRRAAPWTTSSSASRLPLLSPPPPLVASRFLPLGAAAPLPPLLTSPSPSPSWAPLVPLLPRILPTWTSLAAPTSGTARAAPSRHRLRRHVLVLVQRPRLQVRPQPQVEGCRDRCGVSLLPPVRPRLREWFACWCRWCWLFTLSALVVRCRTLFAARGGAVSCLASSRSARTLSLREWVAPPRQELGP